MTVIELRSIAKERGYTGYTKLTKEALVDFINERIETQGPSERRETRGERETRKIETKHGLVLQSHTQKGNTQKGVTRTVPTLQDLLPKRTESKELKDSRDARAPRNIQKDYTPDFLLLGKEEKKSDYIKISQLGKPGKEGTVYLVVDSGTGRKYAMKTFRKTKSGKTLEKEAFYQYLASKQGISPRIIEYNSEEKYIVMEILNRTLIDVVMAQNGKLSTEQQNQILTLYKKLDSIGIMINDANPLNIMEKDGKFYAIDYGFAKFTDHKDFKDYHYPNYQLMPLGLLLWLKERRCSTREWTVIRNAISPEVRNKMNVNEWE